MKRRARMIVKMLKLKAMGFLCGAGMFLATFAIASDAVEMPLWAVEKILIPIALMIIAACGWYVRSVDRRLEDLAKSVVVIGTRMSHIEGKLDISQTTGNSR